MKRSDTISGVKRSDTISGVKRSATISEAQRSDTISAAQRSAAPYPLANLIKTSSIESTPKSFFNF
ncbi:MAG TPA: hypothetical protein ENJ53_03155 [Phaeodactylibacter sp.]|nr:hypothetical protein [Phaeodactylibacter sp.]